MQSNPLEPPDPGRDKRSRLQSGAWQSTIVLTFLALFWGLAAASPSTDKTHPLALVVGAVTLTLLWVVLLTTTILTRERHPIHIRGIVRENPQLWIVVAYLLLSARDILVIPMCDNGAYFKSILDAVRQFNFVLGDSFGAMKLFGHPAQAYAAYMMLGQFVDFAHFPIANVQSRLLGAAGILSFAGIVGRLFPEEERLERVLATALFAFTPLVYGLSMTISPDFGVLAFLCLTVYCAMRGYKILTVASGIMLCFSKEAGALLYGSMFVGMFAIMFPYGTMRASRQRVRAIAGHVWRNIHLAVPMILYALYLIEDGQLWRFHGPGAVAAAIQLTSIDPATAYDKTVQILLANFNWLLWALIGMGVVVGIYRRRRSLFRLHQPTGRTAWFAVLIFTLLPFVLVNYAIVTWNNARYILPLCLFVVLFLLRAVEELAHRTLLRVGLLCLCLGAFVLSSFRTVDPLLLRLFPTFQFGTHKMSFYNSQATVCDLTFYNGEYVYYNRLFDRFLQEAKFDPGKDEFVFFTQDEFWLLADHNIRYLWTGTDWTGPIYIDERNMTRTYDPYGTLLLKSTVFSKGNFDPSQLPAHAYSIQLFWRKRLRELSDAQIRDYYNVVREIHVEEDGYSLDGYELVRRN